MMLSIVHASRKYQMIFLDCSGEFTACAGIMLFVGVKLK
jgi:hypothetical protein